MTSEILKQFVRNKGQKSSEFIVRKFWVRNILNLTVALDQFKEPTLSTACKSSLSSCSSSSEALKIASKSSPKIKSSLLVHFMSP